MTDLVPAPEALTAEWFSSILSARQGLGVRVDHVAVDPLQSQGRASRALRARLSGNGVPPSLVVKMARTERSFLERRFKLGTYRLEVDFYERLAPRLGTLVPHCYHAAADDTDGNFILLLEDLGSREAGAALVDEKIANAARMVARIHARYDGDDSVAAIFGRCALPGMFDHRQVGATEKAMFESLVSARIQTDGLPDRVVEATRAQIAGFDRLAECLRAQRMTCVHGDYHLSQVIERDGPDRGPCVIDWQTPMFGNGMLDIQRLVFGLNLARADRRVLEQIALSEYHRTFENSGISGYSREEMERDYRLALHHTLMRAFLPEGERASGSSQRRAHSTFAMLDAAIAELEYIELIEAL